MNVCLNTFITLLSWRPVYSTFFSHTFRTLHGVSHDFEINIPNTAVAKRKRNLANRFCFDWFSFLCGHAHIRFTKVAHCFRLNGKITRWTHNYSMIKCDFFGFISHGDIFTVSEQQWWNWNKSLIIFVFNQNRCACISIHAPFLLLHSINLVTFNLSINW